MAQVRIDFQELITRGYRSGCTSEGIKIIGEVIAFNIGLQYHTSLSRIGP